MKIIALSNANRSRDAHFRISVENGAKPILKKRMDGTYIARTAVRTLQEVSYH